MKNQTRRLVAVVFIDIEGYTRMTESNEKQAIEAVEALKHCVRKYTPIHKGEIIQYLGDGILSIHDSALNAVNCTIQVQKELIETHHLKVRSGIHLGEVVYSDGNIYGSPVNVASRLQELGVAGSILVSKQVVSQLKNHEGFNLEFISSEYVKNVKEKLDVYAVNLPFLKIPSRKYVHQRAFKAIKKTNAKQYVGVFVFLLLAFFLIQYLINLNQARNQDASLSNLDIKGLTIYPFKNLTRDSSFQDLGTVAAHRITTGLNKLDPTRIADVKVGNVYYSSILDIADIFKMDGASHVVEGEIYLSNDSLIFEASLRSLFNNKTLMALKPKKCKRDDYLMAIDDIANQIMGIWASQKLTDYFISYPNYDSYKHTVLGLTSLIPKNTEEAKNYFHKGIQSDSSFLDAYLYLMDLYFIEREYDSAYQILTLTEEKFPMEILNEREQNMLRFYKYDILGDREKAFSHFEEEYLYNTGNVVNSTTMANLCMEYINNPDKALESLSHSGFSNIDYKKNPYFIDRLLVAMWANIKRGQFNKAEDLIAYFPNDHRMRRVYQSQITLYCQTNDTSRINNIIAKAFLEGSELDRNPNYLYFWAGIQFNLNQQPTLSKYYAGKAVEAYTDGQNPNVMLGRSYFLNEDYEKAMNIFNERILNNPNDRNSLARLGYCYAKFDRKSAALDVIQRLGKLKNNIDGGYVYYHQAVIYNLLNDEKQAIKYLSDALNDGKFFEYTSFDNDFKLSNLNDNPLYQELIHPKI